MRRKIFIKKVEKTMLTSLALIFLLGLAMASICQRLKLPRIIGMLVIGIVLGPYVLDFLNPSILTISADLRKMALIIILLKAGLSLNLSDLKNVGRSAILMACVPAGFEILHSLYLHRCWRFSLRRLLGLSEWMVHIRSCLRKVKTYDITLKKEGTQ